MLCFSGGKLLRNGELVHDNLWVDSNSGRIVDPLTSFYRKSTGAEREDDISVIDCTGKVVSPGLIDVQINGRWIERDF